MNSSVLKSIGFDTVFSNALTGYNQGAAVGGGERETMGVGIMKNILN